jgi:hypothetical protein
VSIFPAFYVNWSRYTQGLGLALLPVAWVLLLEVLAQYHSRQQQRQRQGTPAASAQTQPAPGRHITWHGALQQSGPYMLAVLASAGLALTHYRIAMIYAGFVVLYLLWRVVASVRARRRLPEVGAVFQRIVLVGALTLASLLPWMVNLAQNFTRRFVGRDTETAVEYYSLDRTLGPNLVYHPSVLFMVALGVIGLAISLWRRNPYATLLTLTWLLLGVWSNPYLLPFRLPYAGYLDVTTLLSGAWVPLALLAGYALAEIARGFLALGDTLPDTRARMWRASAVGLLGAALLVFGFAASMSLSAMLDNKPYIARADAEALTWTRDNLPRGSYVLANPFAFPWSPQSVHGSDAGLWVPLAAPGVRTSVPPLPAYNERARDANYLRDLLDVTINTGYQASGPMQPSWVALKEAGITHIFVGTRGGGLTVPVLLESDRTRLLFHKDAAWIFELR